MENSRVRTNSLRSNKANICSDRQQIRHTFAGSVKTATDFPSRVELKITVKIGLKIRLDIQTKIIEVTTSSSDVADEEHFFFTQADNKNDSKKQTLELEERFRKKQEAKQRVKKEESSPLKTSVNDFTKIDGNTTSYSMNGVKANAQIRAEQDVDLVFKNMKLKTPGQPHEKVLMMKYS